MANKEKSNFLFLVYLAGLSVIGFLATDMYLPAFDKMRADLDTSKNSISASLTLFLAGYAIAQLLWGPLADKIGKPRSILMGLGIFTAASLSIYFTYDVTVLLALRLVQAIGVCAAAVSWQALVIERYPAEQTNKVFATIMPLVALSPALAPLLGVFLLDHFNWRSIFIVLAFIALPLMIYTLTLESKTTVGHGSEPKKKGESYIQLLQSRTYIGNVMIYAVCSGAFFAWLTGSPFFLKELGYNEGQIGFSFVPQTIAFMLGGYGYRALSDRMEGRRILPFLLVLYSVAVIGVLAITLITTPTLVMLLIPFCLMALANGACYPIVVAQAMKLFPNSLGKASALQNALQLGTCFLASGIVSLFSSNALLTTALVVVGTIPFVIIGFRLSK
ncbi:drug resistance transporter, Bcr/CflA subfamily [Sphingobacterium nematocida]|uniref:Drug resistance transporter, Bcr/CflA subfamily n=1 Tax=Sphingobacterium nematocida TaxID=1513896 RepID=A0A1T5G0E2_9SPHI|nr:purine nucleoside transporter PunC [Sphingobacterium nematocida]SKC01839.1 drug resistance transporter, Bcr/CflA subfamily [Sphingobacterium nematocida]